jgi:hypothetical protein
MKGNPALTAPVEMEVDEASAGFFKPLVIKVRKAVTQQSFLHPILSGHDLRRRMLLPGRPTSAITRA